MSAEILTFRGLTCLDIPAERVLQGAIDAGLKNAVVLGYDEAGDVFLSSSIGERPEILWLLERAKMTLLRVVDEDAL